MVSLLETKPAPPGYPGAPLRVGFVPLIDCAPLIVAREEGFFADQGVQVILSPQPGWAAVREKIQSHELDAAQCPAGLALALHHGLGGPARRMVVPLILNANGNGITLSNEFPPSLVNEAGGLKQLLATQDRVVTLATVHRYSFHYILLSNWLDREGLRIGQEAQIFFFPPAIIPRNLANGAIDGFCVGEPWNSGAILSGTGWCAATSCDLAPGHPEKAFATSETSYRVRQEEIAACSVALLQACRLCDNPDYRPELCRLLSRPEYLDVPLDILRNSLVQPFETGHGPRVVPGLHRFFGDEINAPSPERVNLLIKAMRQAGAFEGVRLHEPSEIFRENLYQAALAQLPAYSKSGAKSCLVP